MATVGGGDTGWSMEITLATQVLRGVLYLCLLLFFITLKPGVE